MFRITRGFQQSAARASRARVANLRPLGTLVQNHQHFLENVKKLPAGGYAAHVMQNTPSPEAAQRCPYLKEYPHMLRTVQRESNARSYNRRFPLSIQKAKGLTLWDVNGNEYLDMLGCAGTLALGHNHDVMKQAIAEQMATDGPGQVLDFVSPTKDDFINTLYSVCPEDFSKNAKIQFCGPSGTDAMEAALKIAKHATGRQNIIAFHGGYHGHSNGSLALMGNVDAKAPGINLMPGVHFMPYPYSYRCPFGVGGEAGDKIASTYLENVLNDVESGINKPAAVVLECIQGEGGVIPAPAGFLQEVRRITKAHGIVMIVDEIQTGFGRTGTMLAFEDSGITPDIVTMSKAVGGGQPMAVVMYQKELDTWGPGSHAGTFRGNQLAMATGAATLKFITSENLHGQAQSKGKRLVEHLKGTQSRTKCIGDIRGRGLMQGVEIVDPNSTPNSIGSRAASGALAGMIQQEAFKRGMIMEKGGRHGAVMRFLPPLIVSEAQIDQGAGIFEEAVKAAEATVA